MKRRSTTLFCFSPPVMIATFAVEILLAIYTLYKYRFDRISQVTMLLLVFLAVFQLAEYNVCEGAFGVDSLTWSRIGYVAITFLPAFGIHLLQLIARRPNKILLGAVYGLATLFAWFYMTVGHGLTSSVCLGNYVIFNVDPDMNKFYAMYYYGLEFLALGLAWLYGSWQKSERTRKALYGLAFGYACLLIPTTTVNVIDPETLKGIPSIMCGFAVLLALVVVFYVLPRSGTPRIRRKTKTSAR